MCRLASFMPRAALACLLALAGTTAGFAQPLTAFLYQGRLVRDAAPAEGAFDFRFRLARTADTPDFVGPTLTNLAIAVVQGDFSVRLDFGPEPFDGTSRWLEIGVRTNGSPDDFALLLPRQAILPVPYAAFAQSAGTAADLAGGGASLTQVPATALTGWVPLSTLRGITSQQMDLATDSLYRSGTSNRVRVINVRDFGAVGNGLADDTVAISNAWRSFLAEGGTLYFPPGIYRDSGTHRITGVPAGNIDFLDGRVIRGGGSVRWHYTGRTQLLYLENASPDIEGFEFFCTTDATNAVYITNPGNNVVLRNVFFNGWTNATHGALMLDEADSVSLQNVNAFRCKIGFGLGFRCNNLHGDIQTYGCDVGLAVGIPTGSFTMQRQSYNIDLNMMSLYCSNAIALDAGITGATIRGYFWNSTNAAVVLGMIPGISTNYGGLGVQSVTLDHCYFQGNDLFGSAIQLHGRVLRSLNLVSCWFDQTPNSRPLIKSHTSAADEAPIRWIASQRTGLRPEFEDSQGRQFTEAGYFKNWDLNQATGIYNWRRQNHLGGSGYLLDVLDGSLQGPVARFGFAAPSASPAQAFGGGLTVSYNPAAGRAQLTVTNADWVLASPGTITNAATPGIPGSIRWDAEYLYLCVQSNVWKRAPLSSW